MFCILSSEPRISLHSDFIDAVTTLLYLLELFLWAPVWSSWALWPSWGPTWPSRAAAHLRRSLVIWGVNFPTKLTSRAARFGREEA